MMASVHQTYRCTYCIAMHMVCANVGFVNNKYNLVAMNSRSVLTFLINITVFWNMMPF